MKSRLRERRQRGQSGVGSRPDRVNWRRKRKRRCRSAPCLLSYLSARLLWKAPELDQLPRVRRASWKKLLPTFSIKSFWIYKSLGVIAVLVSKRVIDLAVNPAFWAVVPAAALITGKWFLEWRMFCSRSSQPACIGLVYQVRVLERF